MNNMDLSKLNAGLAQRFTERIKTIDSHTAGEPTRLIVRGLGSIPGETMKAKRDYFMERLDRIRLSLTREPRGHRGILAAAVTEPVTPGAAFGLIYMDAKRYPFLCGHATIGAVTTLIEAGAIEVSGSEAEVIVDTPSGPMSTLAEIRDGGVVSVAFTSVPSFVHETDCPLEIPGLGRILVDTVFVGGFFAMVDIGQPCLAHLNLSPQHRAELIDLGMCIIDEANKQLTVRHPTRLEVNTVDVTEFYFHNDRKRGSGAVIYGESHMDRSPCGTGTTAKLTLFHHKNMLNIGERFVNTGPVGTTFEARILRETKVGDVPAVEVQIKGSAYITGIHEFVTSPGDPFPDGYLL